MRATIQSKERKGERWYKGAEIALPADQNAIDDAMQRAQVSGADEEYDISLFKGWPDFLKDCLSLCGQKTIQEVNVLAWKVSRMDETQLETLEGAVKLRMEEDCENPVSIRELINLSYNLDCYDYYHGIADDVQLGEVCLEGDMLDLLDGLPEEVLELPHHLGLEPGLGGQKEAGALGDHGLNPGEGDPLLPLVLPFAVPVGDLGAGALQEEELDDAFACVDLGGKGSGVGDLQGDVAFPAGLQRRHVHHDAAPGVGALAQGDGDHVVGHADVLQAPGEGEGVWGDHHLLPLVLHEALGVKVLGVHQAGEDVGEDLPLGGGPEVVPEGGKPVADDPLPHEPFLKGLNHALSRHLPDPPVRLHHALNYTR